MDAGRRGMHIFILSVIIVDTSSMTTLLVLYFTVFTTSKMDLIFSRLPGATVGSKAVDSPLIVVCDMLAILLLPHESHYNK